MEMEVGPAYVVDHIDESHELRKILELYPRSFSLTERDVIDREILSIARKYMESKGYHNFIDLTNDNYIVMDWRDGEQGSYHNDCTYSDISTSETTYNCLRIYRRFDEGIQGGNLLLYPDGVAPYTGSLRDAPIPCQACQPIGKPVSIDVRPTDQGMCVVCIRGDIVHGSEPAIGTQWGPDEGGIRTNHIEICYPCSRPRTCTATIVPDFDPWD